MKSLKSRALLLATVIVMISGLSARATEFDQTLKPLLAKYCFRCHGENLQEADLRIDRLNSDLVNGGDAGFWHEVLNQLNEGRMPPEDEPQLANDELIAVTTWLEGELKKAADLRNSTGGRQLMRRMSRYEYQYTLEDLLGIALDYSDYVPTDLSGDDGLMTNATLLGMSPVLMESYLEVAEMALNEAIPDGPQEVIKEKQTQLNVTTIRGQRKRGQRKKPVDEAVKANKANPSIIAPTFGFQQTKFVHDQPRKVTFAERPFAGRFAIRIEAKATAASDDRLAELTVHVGHRASGDYDPKRIIGRRTIEPSDQPQIVEFVGNIEDFPLGKKDGYYNGSGSHDVTHMDVYVWNTTTPAQQYVPTTTLEEIDEPLLEVLSVEMEGPLLAGYPSETAKALVPQQVEVEGEVAAARASLKAFLPRAFRRDVSSDEIEQSVESFKSFREITGDFKAAMRKTMAMVLISPKFIYLVEPSSTGQESRKLDAHELANRLSYFLWASMPDDELLSLASSGALLDPEVLKYQVHRMRCDPRFGRFIRHFSSQWLGLSAMENVAVDPTTYPDFSDDIRENLKAETLAFASHVFTSDLSCRNFLRSDFAILNQVVAGHYGMEGIDGAHFRPVPLSPDQGRGGVLTHGSISMIGSDGTESNPIYRGVWLRKRLFADPPPPPPPGAPPLEKPDGTRLTLKQQIELHREATACSRCHSRIDPWGIAFEGYDATGRLKSVTDGMKKGIKFDATSQLPDGTTVKGMAELQAYLLEHKSADLADALVRRMSGYALGRQLEFSDKEIVQQLTARFIQNDYRPSSLIEGIVTTDAFLTK